MCNKVLRCGSACTRHSGINKVISIPPAAVENPARVFSSKYARFHGACIGNDDAGIYAVL